jgi:hypothetical protein
LANLFLSSAPTGTQDSLGVSLGINCTNIEETQIQVKYTKGDNLGSIAKRDKHRQCQ